MEWKIGEIKQVNGEWYQCVVAMQGCRECSFRTQDYCTRHSECMSTERSDKTSVIFKKLEKVGEPYVGNNGTFQSYKLAMPIYGDIPDQIIGFTTTEVVIKQNEEDMEEGKLDPHMEKVIDEATQKMGEEIGRQIEANINKQRMKPFNLEAVKAGRPVCTRDGRKVRIICFDAKGDKPIIALVEMGVAETPNNYPIDGKAISTKETPCDLMMLPEKKEGWINIYERDCPYTDGEIFDTRKQAEDCYKDSSQTSQKVAIIKIEWEE